MTNSENPYGTLGITDADVLNARAQEALDSGEGRSHSEVLGVLTGQVPVKSMPVAEVTPRRNGKTRAGEEWLAEREASDEQDDPVKRVPMRKVEDDNDARES